MSRFSRRDILGGAVTTGAALGAAAVAQAEPKQLPIQNMKKTAQNATVYHCDFGDAGRFSQQLRNINNHLAVYNYDQRALKVVIVAHSAGIKFFLKDLADTPWSQEQIDPQLIERMRLCRPTALRSISARSRSRRSTSTSPKPVPTSTSPSSRPVSRRRLRFKPRDFPISRLVDRSVADVSHGTSLDQGFRSA
jgi:intracellular sulfur oxidation DsrE/DsrF family protein